MKRIAEVRAALTKIDGAFYELPPTEGRTGNLPAVRTIWTADENTEAVLQETASEPLFGIDEGSADETAGSAAEEMFEFPADIDLDRAIAALGEEGARLKQAQLHLGVDALAWYVTFHATCTQWGIYVPVSRLVFLAATLFGELATSPDVKLQLAFRALHQHELFHFAADYMAAQWEGILARPCHKPARKLRDSELGYCLLEEQCANAHMLRSFRWGGKSTLRVQGKTARLRKYVSQQPPGYRDSLHSTERARFQRLSLQLVKDYVACIDGYQAPALEAVELWRFLDTGRQLNWRYCPIHIIDDGKRLGLPANLLGLFRSIVSIIEMPRFKKQLNRLAQREAKAWERAKALLGDSTARAGLDFKFWDRTSSGAVYSVRISRNHRVHLEHRSADNAWIAVAIGSHSAMGHG